MLSHHRIRVNAGLGRMPVACRYFQECKHLKNMLCRCGSMHIWFPTVYVCAFCMQGNVHECVCGLGLASLMHLCRDWAALPSCVPGPGRAAAVAWLIYQLLSHFRAHSDSLSLYTSLPIHLLGLFTSLLGYQPDITEYEDN